ncbi:hypothetical protein Tco_0323276 [Tanacetum coccineum]
MESYCSRFYKMMNEMIRNNLTVATMQVNVQFLQQLQPEWSRFVTTVKQNHDLDTVSCHKLLEVNEIRAKRIAKNKNPLALVATAQRYPDPYYQAPKSHKSFAPPSKQSSSTRSHVSTRYKGKEIAKPITPPSKSASEEDNWATGNQRTVTIAGAKETVGIQVVQQTGIQCFNCKEFVHFAKEGRKPKREVPTADSETDTKPLEKDDSNVIPDSPDMCDNDIQTDQNVKECDDERASLAI